MLLLMDTLTLPEVLDQRPWEDTFDNRTFARATMYHRKGHVVELRYQPGERVDVLLGAVRGSRTDAPSSCRLPTTSSASTAAAVARWALTARTLPR